VADPTTRIKEILEVRNPIYNQAADFKIDTSDLDVDETVKKILEYSRGKE
jgi:shikimate kinase